MLIICLTFHRGRIQSLHGVYKLFSWVTKISVSRVMCFTALSVIYGLARNRPTESYAVEKCATGFSLLDNTRPNGPRPSTSVMKKYSCDSWACVTRWAIDIERCPVPNSSACRTQRFDVFNGEGIRKSTRARIQAGRPSDHRLNHWALEEELFSIENFSVRRQVSFPAQFIATRMVSKIAVFRTEEAGRNRTFAARNRSRRTFEEGSGFEDYTGSPNG